MRRLKMTDWWDKFFTIGIVVKGLDGVLELVGGVLLLFVAPARIRDLAVLITQSGPATRTWTAVLWPEPSQEGRLGRR